MIEDVTYKKLLKYRKKFRQLSSASCSLDQRRYIKDEQLTFEPVTILKNITMHLPAGFFDLEPEEIKEIFLYKDTPDIIKGHDTLVALFTFDAVTPVPENIKKEFEDLKSAMKKLYPGHVFYEGGEIPTDKLSVYWFEYKSPAKSKEKYNLLFLFAASGQCILGKFISPFEDYDHWKPTVLDLLRTITVTGCERL